MLPSALDAQLLAAELPGCDPKRKKKADDEGAGGQPAGAVIRFVMVTAPPGEAAQDAARGGEDEGGDTQEEGEKATLDLLLLQFATLGLEVFEGGREGGKGQRHGPETPGNPDSRESRLQGLELTIARERRRRRVDSPVAAIEFPGGGD